MGGGGGPSSVPSTTTQIQKVELPAWVEKASEDNYKFAQKIANKPYTAYGGQTLADQSPDTLAAYNLFRNSIGAGQGQTNEANDLFSKAGQGIAGLDRSTYMNPFIDDVVNKSMGALDKQRVQALMGNADKARAAGAFGGDRAAVVDAVTNAETAEKAGLLSSQLYGDAFDKSSGLMQQDIANMLSGGQGLLAGGKQLGDQRMQDFTGLLTSGQQQQAFQQAGLDDLKSKFTDEKNYDLDRLNILLSSLGMSPYGKTENTQTQGQQFYQGGGGSDMAGAGIGIALMMGAMMMSDRDDKTDIQKLGKDPQSGLDLYAYRYKGDPKSYPKVVGPMAQDIEKKIPGSTREIKGHRVIKGALAR